MGEEGANEENEHLKDAVAFCFKHAVYAVVVEDTVVGVGIAGRRVVLVETGSRELLLNSGEDDAGLLENEDANGKERTLRVGGAGSGKEKF